MIFLALPVSILALIAYWIAAHHARTISAPTSPSVKVCGQQVQESPYSYDGPAGSYTSGTAGLPTFGSAGTDFPDATAGKVLPPGTESYQWDQLSPDTVYYFKPGGTYIGHFQADSGDVFIGGYTASLGGAILSGNYNTNLNYAIDAKPGSNTPNVMIEYLTIERFLPPVNNTAVNQSASTGWTVKYDTITQNVPGTGLFTATSSDTEDDCLTQNGQQGFGGGPGNGHLLDTLTGGPYAVTVKDNEISYNDVCDLEGTITNTAAGYDNWNPVPAAMRNPHCDAYGAVPAGVGEQGGFKVWGSDGVLIAYNWIHDNFGPGGWADTDNANTTWTGNYISGNDGPGIEEEISYNFGISDNTFVGNDVIGGIGNPDFPAPAVYIFQSGSDGIFGGIPACSVCGAGFPSYSSQSPISGNKFINNGGGVFLYAAPTRYCHHVDNSCTLVDPRVFTAGACARNISTAIVNTTTYAGETTGSPAEDWWDGCYWQVENVSVTGNTFTTVPSQIPDCNQTAWSACGMSGMFAVTNDNPSAAPSWTVASAMTFYRGNTWSGNTYIGLHGFRVWTAQNNTVIPAQWTGPVSAGDKCSGSTQLSTGICTGPFGQDAGSSFASAPAAEMGHAGVRPATSAPDVALHVEHNP